MGRPRMSAIRPAEVSLGTSISRGGQKHYLSHSTIKRVQEDIGTRGSSCQPKETPYFINSMPERNAGLKWVAGYLYRLDWLCRRVGLYRMNMDVHSRDERKREKAREE